MQSDDTAIVWLRNDLRIADNPALYVAVKKHRSVIPLFILDTNSDQEWSIGAASRTWLHHSLIKLQQSLQPYRIPLIIRMGDPSTIIQSIITESHSQAVYWNRRYEPEQIEQDTQIKKQLHASGIEAYSFNGSLLIEPHHLYNKSGKPFQVFTPFWKTHLLNYKPSAPLPIPPFKTPEVALKSIPVDALHLLPKTNWDRGFYTRFTPGETSAREVMKTFLKERVQDYDMGRDRPDQTHTSSLSPHLHFGEISARQVIDYIRTSSLHSKPGVHTFLKQIGWREFSSHLLYHFPKTTDHPLKERFNHFPWQSPDERFELWKEGKTGIPIVDAGMRELWNTGFMHNRVRMITASFLVKNLLVDWRVGARWFWETLVDADLANNTMGWQWVAGSGADASPFFRIFNPILQSQKFDPKGIYIRKWVPELRKIEGSIIHTPWRDPSILPDTEYPDICCSLIESRARALEAYGSTQNKSGQK